jgi:nitrite reductase (NO-forming)
VDAPKTTPDPGFHQSDSHDAQSGVVVREVHDRTATPPVPGRRVSWRLAVFVTVGVALVALSGVTWPAREHAKGSPPTARRHDRHAGATASATLVTGRSALEDGVRYEAYERPDPTLPAVPSGRVKRFRVDVLMHETKVADDKPPLRVWSFGVNGRFMRGTGVSPPIVVDEGDRVEVTLVNGSDASMNVNMPHSLDIHAAGVAPDRAFKTIVPGATTHYSFVARDPGVFMYHCATEPMILHLGSGMAGMFLVKPRNLPKVDRELWLVQQEYSLPPKPGEDPDYAKMMQEHPDVIAFNGYADQYAEHPITVHHGERIRMYVLNPGPTHVSSFHVIGAVFDTTRSEGVTGGPAQTLTLAPATGGSVDFTLRQPGSYPFVDHNFASMEKGAMGVMSADAH